MALKTKHRDVRFGVGDMVRVNQTITEGDKKRVQAFEGMVIAISGKEENKTFTVRRIGSAQIGIEKIFPLEAPVIDSVTVVRKGTSGVRRAKLYYTRDISKREVEKIYRRTTKKDLAKTKKKKIVAKKAVKKSTGSSKKSSKKS